MKYVTLSINGCIHCNKVRDPIIRNRVEEVANLESNLRAVRKSLTTFDVCGKKHWRLEEIKVES